MSNENAIADAEAVLATQSTETRPSQTPLADQQVDKKLPSSASSLDDLAGDLLKTREAPAAADKPAEKPEETSAVVETPTAADVTPTTAVAAPAIETPEPDDALKAFQLPKGASPKSVDSFRGIKERSRAEIQAREERIAAITKELEEARKGSGSASSQEREELAKLRAFREIHDFKGSTTYQERFTKPRASLEDAIFDKLKAFGATDDQIAEGRKAGAKNLNWDEIYSKAPDVRRYCEAQLIKLEDLEDTEKKALVEAAKAPGKLAEEQRRIADQSAQRESATVKAAKEVFLSRPEWQERKIPADATATQKKEIEESNKWLAEQRGRVDQILANNTPEFKAELAVTACMAFDFKRQLDKTTARLKSLEEENRKLRGASSTSGGPATAPVRGSAEVKPQKLLTDTGSALDQLAQARLGSRD